jgi:hypothetical protein
MTDTTQVNIPLLRKAVEWAEVEAAKPPELREWEQNWWVLTPEERAKRREYAEESGDPDYYAPFEVAAYYKAPECGTAYCIAGFVAAHEGSTETGMRVQDVACDALGIYTQEAEALFASQNTIADVRRIAEEIAGERL